MTKSFASTASRFREYASLFRILSIVAIAMATAYLGFTLFRPAQQKDRETSHASPTAQVVSNQQRAEWLHVLESRPLRHPPPPPPPQVVAPPPTPKKQPPPPPAIEIVATMVNPGQTPRAFVRLGGGKLMNVEAGADVGGATIKQIIEGQMTLEMDGQEFTVKIGKKP